MLLQKWTPLKSGDLFYFDPTRKWRAKSGDLFYFDPTRKWRANKLINYFIMKNAVHQAKAWWTL